MRIALVSAEATPFAKTGGLGDAVAGLTRYLARAGHDARLFLPFYSSIEPGGREVLPVDFARDVALDCGGRELRFSLLTVELPPNGPWVYLVHCPALYEGRGIYTGGADDALRMAFLARAALASCQRMGWAPEVVHCNDWHTALLPVYLRTHYAWDRLFTGTRTLLAIHNIGYQGVFGDGVLGELDLAGHRDRFPAEDLQAGRVNFLKTGILRADALATVSPTHAREIQTPEYGAGLDGLLRMRSGDLTGILNGVDYDEWDPAHDPYIARGYGPDSLDDKLENRRALRELAGLPDRPETPVVGIVSRLTKQKGIDLFFEALPWFLAGWDFQLVCLGSGEERYERFFDELQGRFPGKAWFYRGYSNRMAHRIEAGADIFLMPSLYEPCGLNQMYSLRYGTVPVVRRTGGLADSVRGYSWETGEGTGFVFADFNHEGLGWALGSALVTYGHRDAWRRLQRQGMAEDFSWEKQGAKYVDLYRRIVG